MLQITQQLIILTRTFVMVTDSIVQHFYYKPHLNKNTSITCYSSEHTESKHNEFKYSNKYKKSLIYFLKSSI